MPKMPPAISSGANETPLKAWSEFSLVSGGLLYRCWRRTRLSGEALELIHRRVLVTVLLTWVPLLLLSLAEGNAWGGSGAVTFLQDVETQVRLLIAVPLLLLAEVRVHQVLPQIVRLFVERGLIPDAARAVRRRYCCGHAAAQLCRGGAAVDRVRVQRWECRSCGAISWRSA